MNKETEQWAAALRRSYKFESHHEKLLTIACESWDRAQQARAILDEQGLTTVDKNNVLKAHPCVIIERDCKTQFMRAVRELGLDLASDDLKPPARQAAQPFRRSH